MAGNATLTTVASSTIISIPTQRTYRAIQRRPPPIISECNSSCFPTSYCVIWMVSVPRDRNIVWFEHTAVVLKNNHWSSKPDQICRHQYLRWYTHRMVTRRTYDDGCAAAHALDLVGG